MPHRQQTLPEKGIIPQTPVAALAMIVSAMRISPGPCTPRLPKISPASNQIHVAGTNEARHWAKPELGTEPRQNLALVAAFFLVLLPQLVLESVYVQEEGLTVCSRHELSAKRKKK